MTFHYYYLKSHFCRENLKILPSVTQRYNGRNSVALLHLICKPLVVYQFYCMALYATSCDILTHLAYRANGNTL